MDSGLGVYKDKNQLISVLAMNHCLFPPSSTDTWVNLVSSNSSCCSQRDFRQLGSMSQNGSSNCLTNEGICLELNVYNENHQLSCFFVLGQPGSWAPGRAPLHSCLEDGGLLISWLVWLSLKGSKVLPYVQCLRSRWIRKVSAPKLIFILRFQPQLKGFGVCLWKWLN